MVESRVVDTNVLIVASAADGDSLFQQEATPVEEQALRMRVLEWLVGFEQDAKRHVVLDQGWDIMGEYGKKLDLNQDYGPVAIMAKWDRGEVVWVDVHEKDAHGYARIPRDLEKEVTDLSDRKMVAAVLEAMKLGYSCQLTNACDTDWLDCAEALDRHGVRVENLLEDWLRQKGNQKKKK